MINVEEKEHFIILDYEAFNRFFGKYCDLNFTLTSNFSIDNECNAIYKGIQLLFAGIYFERLDKTAYSIGTNFEVWVFIKK